MKPEVTKGWALGKLGTMFIYAIANFDAKGISDKKKEDLRKLHRFLRTLIEEYFNN